jgi:peroxiredoxin
MSLPRILPSGPPAGVRALWLLVLVVASLSPARAAPADDPGGADGVAFSVQTADGRTVSLDAVRGKTILLHFWAPNVGFGGAASLRAVHERFGQDRPFAMIGLCTSDDPEEAAKLIKSNGLSWPQAVLRDGNLDPIVTDYRAYEPNIAFLIGPDGNLLAKVVAGPALENAVAEALSRK